MAISLQKQLDFFMPKKDQLLANIFTRVWEQPWDTPDFVDFDLDTERVAYLLFPSAADRPRARYRIGNTLRQHFLEGIDYVVIRRLGPNMKGKKTYMSPYTFKILVLCRKVAYSEFVRARYVYPLIFSEGPQSLESETMSTMIHHAIKISIA